MKKRGVLVLFFLLCSTLVSAGFIDNVRFGTTGLPVYDSHKVLIDFLLFFALFLGISIVSLKGLYGDDGKNRNPVIAIALVIAVAFAIAALKAGLSAEFLAPFMSYFLFFALVILLYLGGLKLFNVQTTWGKVLTALLAFLLAWLLVALVSGSLTGTGDFPGSGIFSSIGNWFSDVGQGARDAVRSGSSGAGAGNAGAGVEDAADAPGAAGGGLDTGGGSSVEEPEVPTEPDRAKAGSKPGSDGKENSVFDALDAIKWWHAVLGIAALLLLWYGIRRARRVNPHAHLHAHVQGFRTYVAGQWRGLITWLQDFYNRVRGRP